MAAGGPPPKLLDRQFCQWAEGGDRRCVAATLSRPLLFDVTDGEVVGAAGQVFVNAYGAAAASNWHSAETKKSGHGLEKGFEALYEMTTLKAIIIKQVG
jgi:hypothetical protein